DPSLEASRDLILTDSFIRLTNHSICGKEDPLTFHPQWNLDKDRKINEAEALLLLEKAINGQSLAQTINGWKIRHPLYSRLKKALADYRAIKAKGGWKAVPAGRVLKKGMIDPRVQDLRARLADTDGLLETKTDPMTFDSSLAQALMGFQKRHALIADGVMRKGTYEALNVPVEDRIDQIRVNLERARWVLHDPGDTNVFVDIAGYRVFFERDNKIIWSCKAQVGQPYRNTPVFRSVITNIELNPSWVVPPSILIKDVLPAVKKDPSYLRKKHLMVIDERNHEVNPKSINWSLYPDRDFPYRLKQNPGPENSLGQIKINFPNEYLVYMHDTPHKELFAEEVRTFSSGCIRLEKPFELAELLLNDHSKWNLQSIMEAAKPGKTRIINLSTPVTIILFYWTVEVDDNGVVYFSSDPYQRDKAVLDGLGRDADIVKP
ncbi:MAG TPA: L,D-transpeptidase family protein, partial [Desulfomonilia bacterium]|nr:L,D-transpeptidase family protein [Desulfomonilia bacterium]